MKEIGSEFWGQSEPNYVKSMNNEVYLLSGRTALHFIIDDICKNKSVHKVLLPSYCCDSMIFPFVKQGIEVDFYQVNSYEVCYPYSNDADIVFLIDFFGYINNQNIEIARKEKQSGKIVIYDFTHKIDGNVDIDNYVDYSFCSYRKWFYCNFAKAIKHNGIFNGDVSLNKNEFYVQLRDQAAYEKQQYINAQKCDKNIFLSKYSHAEQILDEDYIGYSGVPVVFDIKEIVSKRRENAEYLIKELKGIRDIKLWRDKINIYDTPMFVPIFVDSSIRNELRSYLVSKGIYCPVHWPKSTYHIECNDLYDTEISLICDQRYELADMKRMISEIKEFFDK